MTEEEEAKTKWCPAARLAEKGAPQTVANRFNHEEEGDIGPDWGTTLCLGSACMAWRWVDAFPLPHDPPAISDRYKGYCGLAGKP